jgi:3-hydroxypropanoate dehydrogenase
VFCIEVSSIDKSFFFPKSLAMEPGVQSRKARSVCAEKLPKLFPHADMRSYFIGNQPLIDETAFRNSSLQAAYFILAARSLGLNCGPMSGFDADKLNREFFPDGKWKVNLICNLGYGDQSKLYPRNPRLEFEEASLVL